MDFTVTHTHPDARAHAHSQVCIKEHQRCLFISSNALHLSASPIQKEPPASASASADDSTSAEDSDEDSDEIQGVSTSEVRKKGGTWHAEAASRPALTGRLPGPATLTGRTSR